MTTRTSKRTVTFRRPFVLGGFDRDLPAGVYEVETDEELLEDLSFPAYRRTLTLLRLNREPGRSHLVEVLTIDPNELNAALERERAAEAITDESNTVVLDESSTQHGAGKGAAALSDAADRYALDRAEDEGMIVRPTLRRRMAGSCRLHRRD